MERSHWVLAGPTDSSKIDSTKNLSPLYSCIEAGENRRVLYHYTSVESLLKIVAPAMFKFSRIDRVNDPIEKRALLHEDFYKAAYMRALIMMRMSRFPYGKCILQKVKE